MIGALLVAGFFNLLAVALLAPLCGLLLRRRRRDLPFMIARDYAGTALLVLITVGAAGGRADPPLGACVDERADQRAVFGAVHDYVVQTAPAFVAGLGTLDDLKLEPDRYRACVPGPEKRPICLFVNTDQSPAGVDPRPVARAELRSGGARARAAAASRGTRGSSPGTRRRRRRRGSGGRR